MSLPNARSTSFITGRERFAFALRTTIITFALSSPRMISLPQFLPGRTSRGAIQQRMPACSSREHIALATVLS